MTGATGRIGRAVVDAAAARAMHVRAIARRGSHRDTVVDWRSADLDDPSGLDDAIDATDAVVHLAGEASTAVARSAPLNVFRANALGTVAVLDSCRRKDVPRVVLASSAQVYGPGSSVDLPEDAPTRPDSPYAASKLAAELAGAAFAETYGLSVIVARISNVYGPGFTEGTVAGDALAQARTGGPIRLRDLSPIRDFIHLRDVAEALLRLAEVGTEPTCRIVNVSTGIGTSVRRMAEIFANAAGELRLGRVEVVDPAAAPRESPSRLVLANARLHALTGWRPDIMIERGILEWLKHETEAMKRD